MNNLILEDGYNSDYIYSLIIALFYIPSDGLNKIINGDTNNSNTYYIQEYIKTKFIYPIHRNKSIEASIVNKLRMFMYNCGWQKNAERNILDKGQLDEFYIFLMGDMMEYNLQFAKINPSTNTSKIHKIDMLRITKEQLTNCDPIWHNLMNNNKIGGNEGENNNDNKFIDLSCLVNQWINDEIIETSNSYKFESMPCIIPIYLDIRDPITGYNIVNINIMEGLHFDTNGDKIQRMFVWEIHSLICQNSQGYYYAVTIDHNNVFMAFSDKHIPSNWKIDTTNIETVKNIMKEVRFVFYKIQ